MATRSHSGDTAPGAQLLELLEWLGRPKDDWESVPAPLHYAMFGGGSRRPFPWYFTGRSRVPVATVSEVEEWLRDCLYVSDQSLFGEDDHWMHPGEFEYIRMGDCDDHALWAWRKLVELRLRTSFVIGRWHEEPDSLHTWLLTSISDETHVFEATSKVAGTTLRPLDDVRDAYRPYFSVDDQYRTRVHLGWARDLSPFETNGAWSLLWKPLR